jgi:hypothetical protein
MDGRGSMGVQIVSGLGTVYLKEKNNAFIANSGDDFFTGGHEPDGYFERSR